MTAEITEIRKTMLDFLIWYYDLNMTEICRKCEMAMPTMLALKRGDDRKFNKRTLQSLADHLQIKVSDFYDIKKRQHIYFEL